MSRVQHSGMQSIEKGENRTHEAVKKIGGKISPPLKTSKTVLHQKSVINSRDGEVANLSSEKRSSNNSYGSSGGKDLSNIEDYNTKRSKLAFSKQQKGTRPESVTRTNPGTSSRRRGRRNGHAEKVRKNLGHNDSHSDGRVGESGHKKTGILSTDSETGEKSVIDFSDSSANRNGSNEAGTLSNFMAHPQHERRRGRRRSKSANRTITSSSSAATRKHSNRSVNSNVPSMDEFMNNSTWADGGSKNTELAIRHPVTPTENGFHQQHSNYHWINSSETSNNKMKMTRSSTPNKDRSATPKHDRSSTPKQERSSTPKSDRPLKTRLARRRSNGDVETITPTNSVDSRKPRRKLRTSSSWNLDPEIFELNTGTNPISTHSTGNSGTDPIRSNTAANPVTPHSSTSKKIIPRSGTEPIKVADPVLMTPKNVLHDPKSNKSSLSANLESDPIRSNTATNPVTPHSSMSKTSRPAILQRSATAPNIVVDPAFITPKNTFQGSKSSRYGRSISGRVMVAAESSKTPMASLRKILRKELSGSGKSNNDERTGKNDAPGEGGSPGLMQRKAKARKITQSLLRIPFIDGGSNSAHNERGANNDVDNSKPASGMQAFAKSMKKQAQHTKRKIGRKISETAKAATISRSAAVARSHVPLDSTAGSNTYSYDSDESGSFDLSVNDKVDDNPDSPLPLKAPSGHSGWGDSYEEWSSDFPRNTPKRTGGVARQANGLAQLNGKDEEKFDSPLALPPSGITKEDVSPLTLRPPSFGKPTSQVGLKRASSKDRSSQEPTVQHANHSAPPPLIVESDTNQIQEESGLPVNEDQKVTDGKKVWKKRRSKMNINSRTKKSENQSKNSTHLQSNSSIASSLHGSANFDVYPVFENSEESGHSSPEMSVKISGDAVQVTIHKPISEADGDPKNKKEKSFSFHKPFLDNFEGSDRSLTQKTELTTSTMGRCLTCKQMSQSDRDSSISTLVSNLSQTDTSQPVPNSTARIDIRQKVVPIQEVISEKEASQTMNSLLAPLRDDEEPESANVSPETAISTITTNEMGHDELPNPSSKMESDFTGSEVPKVKTKQKGQTSSEEDVSSELFDLLRNESRRIRKEAKGRVDTLKDRVGKKKKHPRKTRQKKNFVDTDITINTDPLEISEITTNLNPPTEEKNPTKHRSPLLTKKGYLGKVQTGDATTKERRMKADRRGSGSRSGSRSKSRRDRSSSMGAEPVNVSMRGKRGKRLSI